MKRYRYDSISIAPEDADDGLTIRALNRINEYGLRGQRTVSITVYPTGWIEALLETEIDDETPTA